MSNPFEKLLFREGVVFAVDDAFVQTMKKVFGGDGDKKNLVDPYLEVSFAGKKVLQVLANVEVESFEILILSSFYFSCAPK